MNSAPNDSIFPRHRRVQGLWSQQSCFFLFPINDVVCPPLARDVSCSPELFLGECSLINVLDHVTCQGRTVGLGDRFYTSVGISQGYLLSQIINPITQFVKHSKLEPVQNLFHRWNNQEVTQPHWKLCTVIYTRNHKYIFTSMTSMCN